jgi:ATP-dependent helicase YprA (DUF1998 family)
MMGKHIAISTATSSGKSVVYNVPVLTKLLEATRCGQPEPVAIYLFPTKALAQVRPPIFALDCPFYAQFVPPPL